MDGSLKVSAKETASLVETKQREEYNGIHLLRILSCYMVIVIHVSCGFFDIFSPRWNAANFYDSLSRGCVPIFFMISGWLLIGEDSRILSFYRKRLLRILVPFVFYSCIYLYYNNVPISKYVVKILKGPVEYHLWYVYTLIGIYIFIPFLSKLYNAMNSTERFVLILMWFSCDIANRSLTTTGKFPYNFVTTYNLGIFTGYWGYCLLGRYLKDMAARYRTLSILAFTLSALCIALLTYEFSHRWGKPTTLFYSYSSLLVFLSAVSLFFALCKLQVGRRSTLLQSLAAKTYGIYLIHILVLKWLERINISAKIGSPWIMIPLLSLVCFVVSLLIVSILKKIKWIKTVAG